MSDRFFRLTILFAALAATASVFGCQNSTPYVQKTGWNPFARNETSRSAEEKRTVARGQMGSYSNDYSADTLVYGNDTDNGTAAANGSAPAAAVSDTTKKTGNAPAAEPTQTNGAVLPSTSYSPQKAAVESAVPQASSTSSMAAAASSAESNTLPPLPALPSLPNGASHPLLTPQNEAAGNYAPLPEGNPRLASAAETAPPSASEFPEFAKNAYGALENVEEQNEAEKAGGKAVPPRARESLVDREKAEKELEAKYKAWLAEQKAAQKEKSKTPRYLQPLSDDRDVFENPNSPFARQMQKDSESEHKFVRQITAADLNMMSDVSSTTELMDWEKEQDGGTDWSKYSGKALYNKWRDFLGMGVNEQEALAVMRKACLTQNEYEETGDLKKLKEAGALYEKAGKKWPDSLLEEDALFYAGECHFFRKDYTKAKTFYKQLLTKYSNSTLKKEAAERLYYLGCYWVQCSESDPTLVRMSGGERPRFSDFAGAKDAFQTIFMNDVSDRGRAPDALFALANAYMRRGVEQGDDSFCSAARYYQQLYEFYPACDHVDKAYQLAMLALYMSYRGPLYDSTPLKKAAEIAEAASKAKRGDKDVIAEQLRLIREEQARYLLVRGEYYEKQKIYAAARNYYNQLAQEYPESPFTEQAASRYAKIRDYPAEADQYAFIRPFVPFLPRSANVYYEDRPGVALETLAGVKPSESKAAGEFAQTPEQIAARTGNLPPDSAAEKTTAETENQAENPDGKK